MPFLSHEAFHYYVQDGWQDPSFKGLSYSEAELDLLNEEYIILDKIHDILEADSFDRGALSAELLNYVEIMNERIEKTDTEKLQFELGQETIEGTAEYAGMKAADAIGYDLGIMYFTNTTDVQFSDIVPSIRDEVIDQSLIGSKMVYESGALLSYLLEVLEVENWQERLNNNNSEEIITLYDLISEYVSEELAG